MAQLHDDTQPRSRRDPDLEAALAAGDPADASNSWLVELAEQHGLTPKGREIARYLVANPRFGSFASASELADKLSVNVATVVRFAQGLGFGGWPEFQLHFRHRYLGTLLPADLGHHHDRSPRSAVAASLERDVQNLTAAWHRSTARWSRPSPSGSRPRRGRS